MITDFSDSQIVMVFWALFIFAIANFLSNMFFIRQYIKNKFALQKGDEQ